MTPCMKNPILYGHYKGHDYIFNRVLMEIWRITRKNGGYKESKVTAFSKYEHCVPWRTSPGEDWGNGG